MSNTEEKKIIEGKSSFNNPEKMRKLGGFLIFLAIAAAVGVWWLWYDGEEELAFLFVFCPILLLVGILLILGGKNEITVTDKRVFGKDIFGSRVDLPFDMISAVGTNQFLHGISVASAAGRIRFLYIRNAEEIHTCINEILMKRQKKETTEPTSTNSDTEELKKYKDLLDSGVITQEEFDAKKKQILGL